MIKIYRKKPIPVEVIQYTGNNGKEIEKWSNDKVRELEVNAYTEVKFLKIYTLEGIMQASISSYIIKGAEDEFWAVKESIFEKTYEEVND